MRKLAMQIIYIYTNDVFNILLEQRMPFDFADHFFLQSTLTWMLMSTCFLCVFGSSVVHGYSSGVLNAPEFVSNSMN